MPTSNTTQEFLERVAADITAVQPFRPRAQPLGQTLQQAGLGALFGFGQAALDLPLMAAQAIERFGPSGVGAVAPTPGTERLTKAAEQQLVRFFGKPNPGGVGETAYYAALGLTMLLPAPKAKTIRLFHGSPHGFVRFDTKLASETGLGGRGFFFHAEDQKAVASAYAETAGLSGVPRAPQVIFLDVPKAKLASLEDLEKLRKAGKLPKSGNIDEAIKELGFEGYFNSATGEYILFDPNKFLP
jgi:hypothetical protein